MLPPAVRMIIVFVVGAGLGSVVNWAIYSFAWNPRPISPWWRGEVGGRKRSWIDRIPILGWLALRREAAAHGPWFWVRPLLLEAAMGAALAAMYWWEIERLGLIRGQLFGVAIVPPLAAIHWQFVSHALLLCLMVAASFIDIDEKIIPDEITIPGTLLGLIIATLVPASLLPNVAERGGPPGPNGVPAQQLVLVNGAAAMGPGGGGLWLEPMTAVAPREWPPNWGVPRRWPSLAIALGCYWMWCFALTPRIWRGRRGPVFALQLICRRVRRELARGLLLTLLIVGTLAIVAVWMFGSERWSGLLTALIGLVGGGGLVWAVRLIGTAALRREAMGFGDVTLMMMIGTFLGWQACLIAFFLAPFAGLLVGIGQLLFRRDDVIPYGPFLCLGTATAVIEWGRIWTKFQEYFEADVLSAMPPGVLLSPRLQQICATTPLVPILILICLLLLGSMLTIWRIIKEIVFGSIEAD